jgi:hypothetical protein
MPKAPDLNQKINLRPNRKPLSNHENAAQKLPNPMTKPPQNANLKELSQSGNDLSVASVQKLANRGPKNQADWRK